MAPVLTRLAVLVCVLNLGCTSSVQPPVGRQPALLTTVEGDPLIVLDLASGSMTSRPSSGLGSFIEDSRTYAADSQSLVYSGGGHLVGFDCNALTVRWTEILGQPGAQRFSGEELYPYFAMAGAQRSRTLLVADAHRNDTVGVGVLNALTRDAIGFIPRLRAAFLIAIPPGAVDSSEVVLGVATTTPSRSSFELDRRQGWFFMLDPVSAQIRDSFPFLPTADSTAGGVASIVLDPSGRWAYFSTYAKNVYRYDLLNRRVIASQHIETYGALAISPDGKTLVLADGTSSVDSPGSGLLYVIDATTLAPTTVDLTSGYFGSVPPVMHAVSFGLDGRDAFVGVGTAARGPLYGVQRGRVLVIDLSSRQLTRAIDLDSWGVRSVLPLR
jgi:hypothetical protein